MNSSKNPMKCNNEERIKDNPDGPVVCLYCLACLDVMGVEEELSPFSDDDFILNPEKHDEFEAVIGPLFEFIKIIRDYLKDFFKGTKNNNVSFFSDSFIIGVPLGEEIYSSTEHAPIIEGIFLLFKTCGFIFLLSLAHERTLRGGIDVGAGLELENDEIFGPALIKAYKLEKHEANYPRIIIGNSLMNYLEQQKLGNKSTDTQPVEDIQKCQSGAIDCLKLIAQDKDYYILDYLNEEFINMWKESGYDFDDIKKKALKYVEQYFKQIKSDPDLNEKYNYLLEYMKERLLSA